MRYNNNNNNNTRSWMENRGKGNGDMKRLLVGRKLLMMLDVDRFQGAEDRLGWIWEVRSRLGLPLVVRGGRERERRMVVVMFLVWVWVHSIRINQE